MRYYCTKVKYLIGFCGTRRRPKRIHAIAYYLRSMVAHPLTGFCPDGLNAVRAALLIDTDVAGFFRVEDREMLELILSEFAARIDLEYAISGLTGER